MTCLFFNPCLTDDSELIIKLSDVYLLDLYHMIHFYCLDIVDNLLRLRQ